MAQKEGARRSGVGEVSAVVVPAATERPATLSVGIGLTNDCNLRCAHCYRDTLGIDHVPLEHIKLICEHLPVSGMGFGTGENALHPQFREIVAYLRDRGVKLSMASNGYSIMALPDELLLAFHDLEVSIDFATEREQDAFRGAGNWALVHEAMARCHRLHIPVSILATLMSINYDQMDALVGVARAAGAMLRVNAYQSVKTDAYRLSYEAFWEGYRRLFAEGKVVSCAEPVVRAVLGLGDATSPCGRTSIRFNQRGQIIPCVYWPLQGTAPSIRDLPRLGLAALETPQFRLAREVPPTAAGCPCQGGCATRRALNGNLDAHDDYCPWVRGETIGFAWQAAPAVDLMRARNVCTTIVAP